VNQNTVLGFVSVLVTINATNARVYTMRCKESIRLKQEQTLFACDMALMYVIRPDKRGRADTMLTHILALGGGRKL
jgi:hypothetical protein